MVQEDGDGHGPQRHALHRRRSEEQEASAATLREETGEISEVGRAETPSNDKSTT